jgi:N,N'-diacetyllegionaminate synthase
MIEIAGKKVGDGEDIFITFEAGPTHRGVESAKRLANSAKLAGADAIKFQILDPDRLINDRTQAFQYEVLINRARDEVEVVEEPLYELLRRRALTEQQWRHVAEYCRSIDLAFFATVGFKEEIKLVEELGCSSIKIASADLNHAPLLRAAARTGLCIQIDTGMSTLAEVEFAVHILVSEGNDQIIIHHCPSVYPARMERINLRVISTLKRMFPYPVGFSDHSPGWKMDIAAISIGASLIEKTVTEDRTTRSVEHIMSLEDSEMVEFVKDIRNLQVALGVSRPVWSAKEIEGRKKIRRGAYLTKDVQKGGVLEERLIEFRRPEKGLNPSEAENCFGREFSKNISAGSALFLDDLCRPSD